MEPKERIERAYKHVHDICGGRERWTMRVPVDESRDSDMVIADGLKAGEEALAQLAAAVEWRKAVSARLALWEMVATTPEDSLKRLIDWEVKAALDPCVSAEAAALRDTHKERERDEALPYMRAVQNAHNGYSSEMQEAMPGCKEPDSPEDAIDGLIDDAYELGDKEARLLMQSEHDRLAAENAKLREALEAIRTSDSAINGYFTHCDRDDIEAGPMQIARSLARAALAQAPDEKGGEVLDDGFGNQWDAKCPDCGGRMEIVRPGKVQCSTCDAKGGEA